MELRATHTYGGPMRSCQEVSYEHLDHIVRRPANRLDLRFYRVSRGWCPDSSVARVCRHLSYCPLFHRNTNGVSTLP